MNLKLFHKIGCYLPYYFIVIAASSWLFIHKDYNFLDSPPPPPFGQLNFPSISSIASRIMIANVATLSLYLTMGFPILIGITIYLCRSEKVKKPILLHYVAFVVVIITVLFSFELLMK